MVNQRGGTIPDMALRRVLGKPFSVSEYGHPYTATAPKTCVSEVHLLRAAYAGFQDWDYLSATRYASTTDWDTRRITDNLTFSQHPTKMLTLIPAAAMFPPRRCDVGQRNRSWRRSTGIAKSRLCATPGRGTWCMPAMPAVPPEAALIHRIALAPTGAARPGRRVASGPGADRRRAVHFRHRRTGVGPELEKPRSGDRQRGEEQSRDRLWRRRAF